MLAHEGREHIRSQEKHFCPFPPQGLLRIEEPHCIVCDTDSPKDGQQRSLPVADLQHVWLSAAGRVWKGCCTAAS